MLPLQVLVRVKDGKGVKHDGIKVEFVGSIGEFDLQKHVPFARLHALHERGGYCCFSIQSS